MKFRDEILKKIDSIPPIPVVAVRVLKMLNDPELSMDMLADTIKFDPALTANILRLANSTFFGFSTPAATVRDALVRIGISRISRLVIASSVQPVISGPLNGYCLDAGELWRHSVGVGLAAESLESELNGKEDEIIFTAGLLHDIGKLAIASFIERYFESIQEKARQKEISFEVAEREVLGIDHTELGSAVLQEWHFPKELVTVVRWHHDPDCAPENQHLADLVHIADVVSMMMGVGVGSEGLQYHPSSEAMSRLGLKKNGLEIIACRTLGKMNELLDMFKSNPENEYGQKNVISSGERK